MGAAAMSPLLVEYIRRRNSLNISTARNARELLLASIHEAGHWMAFAHFKVPVVHAIVERVSNIGAGCVTPADYPGFVTDEKIPKVDYIVTLAGPGALCALIPFVDMENIRITSLGDKSDALQLFDRVHGNNREARKLFREKYVPITENLIRQNWSIIEALAYELMLNGKLNGSQCEKIEKRYGIGRNEFTSARQASARQKLTTFHSSPDALLVSLRALQEEAQKQRGSHT